MRNASVLVLGLMFACAPGFATEAARRSEAPEVIARGEGPLPPEPGMVIDSMGVAVVVDTAGAAAVGSVSISPQEIPGSCAVSFDGSVGFVANYNQQLWAIDLAARPPVLAAGTNPIPISNGGGDLASTYDGRYLIVCGRDTNWLSGPISVVDVVARAEVSTYPVSCVSVDVCRDGSVLFGDGSDQVRRLLIDESGHLSDTGESISLPGKPNNVYCSRQGNSGLVFVDYGREMRSFKVHGMIPISTRRIPGGLNSGEIARDGSKALARQDSGISAFALDPLTGFLSTSPVFSVAAPPVLQYRSNVPLAIDHSGTSLFVPTAQEIAAFDAATGDALPSLAVPDLVDPVGICFRPNVDRDRDDVEDDAEDVAGTDPGNPDTDGDGLLDGFELQFGFDPLVSGQQFQDPDGDELDNLGEQTAGTDPIDADTDDDALEDGSELQATGTDPRNPDCDADGLTDGAEVVVHGTDPLRWDTDDGGASDALEIHQGTDPLNPSDDPPPELGMILGKANIGFVVDPISGNVSQSLAVGQNQRNNDLAADCIITPNGRLGLATDYDSELWVFDVASRPPRLAEGTNPIPISNRGEDLAATVDGRFAVACAGLDSIVSVIDIDQRLEVDHFDLGSGCTAVDICRDGSVLITSFDQNLVRRLVIDGTGHLSDTGEILTADEPLNVQCSPDAQSGIVVMHGSSRIRSFKIPGLLPVAERALSGTYGISGVVAPDGSKFFVRSGSGRVDAFGFDSQTATLTPSPLFGLDVWPALAWYGVDQIALDHAGDKLFVAEESRLAAYDATTGARLPDLNVPGLQASTGVCFRPHGDRDADGLLDDEEALLGTNPDDVDSDADGLTDGFEARHGFDPLAPGEGSLDSDGDGLDNLSEQEAGTDPADADSDDDELFDGFEAQTSGTDPRAADSDVDGLTDGAELHTYASDPLNHDTDAGGATDGNEARRSTNLLDPADDPPHEVGLLIGRRSAVAIDPVAAVAVGNAAPENGFSGDCALTQDGRLGFMTGSDNRVWVIDTASRPPAVSPGLNPIPVTTRGLDIAATPDGRFMIVCGDDERISVIDVASRGEVNAAWTGEQCRAVDVCRDGSVLVALSAYGNHSLRRFTIDESGQLSPGGRLGVHDPMNVTCSPNGKSAVVATFGGTISSFRVPEMTFVSHRNLSHFGAVAGVISKDGSRYFVRSYWGSVDAFAYDQDTGVLGRAPVFTLATGSAEPFAYGVDQLALDSSDAKLYVPQALALRVFDAKTGAPLPSIDTFPVARPQGICFRPPADRDGDALEDFEEARLGTDPARLDTDGDGLHDGFEVGNGFNPLAPGEQVQDTDGDGLANLGEQTARTGPREPDTDGDGLRDGQEVHTTGSDPRDRDSDGDGVLDPADNCALRFNPAQRDEDLDGRGDECDNCREIPNASQTNRDGDASGDVCDRCPALANSSVVDLIRDGEFNFSSGPTAWLINGFGPHRGGNWPPISGQSDVVSFRSSPTAGVSQSFYVPVRVRRATLEWSDRVVNYAADFVPVTQTWRVYLFDNDTGARMDVFTTQPGDPLLQFEPNRRSVDVTGILQSNPRRALSLVFSVRHELDFLDVALDDVRLVVETGSACLAPIVPLSEDDVETE